MNLLDDTHPEARRVQIDAYRRMSSTRKCELMEDAYRTARLLHLSGFRLRNEQVTPELVAAEWVKFSLGPLADCCKGAKPMDLESVRVLPIIHAVMGNFQRLGIPCALTG